MPSQSAATPLLIVLEGIDGSGSTTQGDRLTTWLRNKGYRVFFTHEPSSGPAGMIIRLALSRRLLGSNFEYQDRLESQDAGRTSLDPHSLALLYAADRMDHLATEILPNLNKGRIVVCDRYVLSTLAYQGLSVDEDWLLAINRFARAADLTIYLDVPVEHARHRMRRTRWTKELYEDEDQLRLIRERYQALIRTRAKELGPCITVDASLPPTKVTTLICDVVSKILPPTNTNRAESELTLFRGTT